MRGLVTSTLTTRRVDAMEPQLQAITDALISGVEGEGGCDLVPALAYRLPARAGCAREPSDL